MPAWIPWLLAIISTGAFVALWFWEARRVLNARRSTVESAAAQLAACQRRAGEARGDPDAAAVLARSESIWHQAVDLYNEALRKPWLYLPGTIMGFEIKKEEWK